VSSLTVPGDSFFPESIAATPDGTLFVGSVVTGEILRYRPGSTTAETLVAAGVNAGTAGVFADTRRGVLWACAVDLTFQTPTALRALDLRTGALRANYQLADRSVCTGAVRAAGARRARRARPRGYVTEGTASASSVAVPTEIIIRPYNGVFFQPGE
jgi:hypothetical protein